MKKLVFLLTLAVVLGSVLLVVPSGKTAHAETGGCYDHSGIHYTVDQSPDAWPLRTTHIVYGPATGTLDGNSSVDAWPCIFLKGSHNNRVTAQAFVSFRHNPDVQKYYYNGVTGLVTLVSPALADYCWVEIDLRGATNNVLAKQYYNCESDYINNRVGAGYGDGHADVNGNEQFSSYRSGTVQVTVNVFLMWYTGGELETTIQGTSPYNV